MIKHALLRSVASLILVFLSASAFSRGCYESSIQSPTPFMGNNGELFKLVDGSVWEVKYEYEYMYEYYPSVIVCPDRGKLIIGEKSLNVQLMSTPSSVGRVHGQTPVAPAAPQMNYNALAAQCVAAQNALAAQLEAAQNLYKGTSMEGSPFAREQQGKAIANAIAAAQPQLELCKPLLNAQ